MATGGLSTTLEAARSILADSTAFRTLTTTATHAEALARVYRSKLPPPADNGDHYTQAEIAAYCPYAIVGLPDGPNYRKWRDAEGTWPSSGTLWIALVRSAPDIEDMTEIAADEEWEDTVGTILDDLCDLSETGGNLMLTRIQLEMIGRPPVEEESAKGQQQVAFVLIDWGIGGGGG